MRARATLIVVTLIAAGLVAGASPTRAAFHLMRITEVFAGQTVQVNSDFVELRMYSAGQDLVQGHILKFYDGTGSVTDCTIPSNVTNPANQSHILFATAEAQAAFGQADFTIPPGMLHKEAGAVCFENIDCVGWGSFSGQTTSAYGNPEAEIPLDQSIHRNLGADNTLQASDDTNDSANDFAPGPESATANGALNLGTTPCQPGTATGIGGGGGGGKGDPNVTVANLKAKTPGNKAVISGRIEPPDPGGKVKLILFAKSSPFRKVGKKSDTLDGASRFKKRFKIPSDSTRCKVTVKYRGNVEAIKKFKC